MDNAYDVNGFKIKPGHTGHHGPNLGGIVWLLERHDGKLIGPFGSRHDVVGYEAICHDCDDYEIHAVRAGSVRLDDVARPRDRL